MYYNLNLHEENHTKMNLKKNREHAIVIGASFAGLIATRVLSDHFEKVTLLERDEINDQPETRNGQPQTRHVHGLLPSGLDILCHYFKDLKSTLEAEGAILNDIARSLRWHTSGGYWGQYDSGLTIALVGRPFLEWQIRKRVKSLSNVSIQDKTKVVKLNTTSDQSQVTGVDIEHPGGSNSLSANLVVDTTGRSALTLRWLEELGYKKPSEKKVTVDVNYTSRIFKRNEGQFNEGDAILITPDPPNHLRLGALFPMENNRWIVSLAGWGGDKAPTDDEGFRAFAKSLPSSKLYDVLVNLEPLGDAYTYRFPANLRRMYEELKSYPDGLLTLGDSICSFNPVYGQGMTSASMQAQVLDKELAKGNHVAKVWQPFFKQAGKLINIPWDLATGADFAFSSTEGSKPVGTDMINRYMNHLQRSTHNDKKVLGAFLKVLNLTAAPPSVLKPNILMRVLLNSLRPSKN